MYHGPWLCFCFVTSGWGDKPKEGCHDGEYLDIFETPVTVNPRQKIPKTLNSSKMPSKDLTFTFGKITFTFGRFPSGK